MQKFLLIFLFLISARLSAQVGIPNFSYPIDKQYSVKIPTDEFEMPNSNIVVGNNSNKYFSKIIYRRYPVRDSLGVLVKTGGYENKTIFDFHNDRNIIIEERSFVNNKPRYEKKYGYNSQNLIKKMTETGYDYTYKNSITVSKTFWEYGENLHYSKRFYENELSKEEFVYYDSEGNIVKKEIRDYIDGILSGIKSTEYHYDLGLLKQEVKYGDEPYSIFYSYDDKARVINNKWYNTIDGSLLHEKQIKYEPYVLTQYDSDGEIKFKKYFTYDSEDRLIEVISESREYNMVDTTRYSWDDSKIIEVYKINRGLINNKVGFNSKINISYVNDREESISYCFYYIINPYEKSYTKYKVIYDEYGNWIRIVKFEHENNIPTYLQERIIKYKE